MSERIVAFLGRLERLSVDDLEVLALEPMDPAEHDDTSNDLPESWCDASRTPGSPNPDC